MKSVLKAYLYYIKVIALFLLLPATAQAQADSLRAQRKPFFPRLLNGITEFFMGCDTNYITPQKYQFTTQADLSYWHDFYRLRSSETGNTMTIQSVPSVVLGGYIYYSILGYGFSWNLGDIGKPKGQTNGTSMRQGLVLNTA